MRAPVLFACIILLAIKAIAQQPGNTNGPDALQNYRAYINAYDNYSDRQRDSAIKYASLAVSTASEAGQPLWEAYALTYKAYEAIAEGYYAQAMQYLLSAANKETNARPGAGTWLFYSGNTLTENRLVVQFSIHYMMGILLNETMNYEESNMQFEECTKIASGAEKWPVKGGKTWAVVGIAYNNILDSNFAKAREIFNNIDTDPALTDSSRLAFVLMLKGHYYTGIQQNDSAKQAFENAISITNDPNTLSRCFLGLSRLLLAENKAAMALQYTNVLASILRAMGAPNHEVHMGRVYQLMSDCYSRLDEKDSAYKYAVMALHINDSINAAHVKSLAAFQTLNYAERERLVKLEREQQLSNIWLALSGLGVLALFAIAVAVIQFRNSKQRRKINLSLQNALSNLQTAQSQLIQSEKMASLGELTAGIAHEIQNPLNFVNNFSEVSAELVDEMKAELAGGNNNEAAAIADDIKQNLEKINHHGKRADAIVKGMLQHSRKSTGQKERININALCDEYLRLSYQGLRVKDKLFIAATQTNFDENAGKIRVVPQEIGRVLLNIFSNAFYAVEQKAKAAVEGYQPMVSVTTKKEAGKMLITITDNGNGIPAEIADKIFQPFFTTKPAGQGTGLGLSLSYDIVKAHGGQIRMITKEAEGTTFIIQLPVG